MIDLIENNRKTIEDLCRKHHVARLDVFGSAVNGKFDPEKSDLDFLVKFRSMKTEQRAESFWGLIKELESLFGKTVDLLTVESVRNPYLRRSISNTRIKLYAA